LASAWFSVVAGLMVGCSSGNATTDGNADANDAGNGNHGGDGGATSCQYPAGPYGLTQGSIVPPDLSWQGFAENGDNTPTTIRISDFLDCDGSKGINALLVAEAAYWCDKCVKEAQGTVPLLGPGEWGQKGVHVVTLVVQDFSGNPATITTARNWRTTYQLTQETVCADPDWTFGDSAMPLNILIDPRTMRIVYVRGGYGGVDTSVEALANKNLQH
jgi:hypothetical protein